MSPLFFDVGRLNEQKPRRVGEVSREMFAIVWAGRQGSDFDFVERRQAALTFDLEGTERFDLIAKELDSRRRVPVGSKYVDNASANRDFARQFDGARVIETSLDEPARQF